MKVFYIFSLLTLSFSLNCQKSWELNINSERSDVLVDIIDSQDKGFQTLINSIDVNKKGEVGYDEMKILFINKDGRITDEKLIDSTTKNYKNPKNLYKIGLNYLLFGNRTSLDNTKNEIFVDQFDSNFNFINGHAFSYDTLIPVNYFYSRIGDSIICMISLVKDVQGPQEYVEVIIYNENGSIINRKLIKDNALNSLTTACNTLDNKFILLTGVNTYMLDSKLNIVNSDLWRISSNYISSTMYTTLLNWCNKKYLMSYDYYGSDLDTRVVKIGDNFSNVIRYDETIRETHELQAENEGMAFINPNDIFISGKINSTSALDLWSDNSIFVTKLDSNLKIKWRKVFQRQNYHSVIKVLPTADGGVIIGAHRNVSNKQLTNIVRYQIYLLKLDSDGNLITNTDDQSNINWNITVYPNPSAGNFKVKLDDDFGSAAYRIELYDMSGNKVMSQAIENNVLELDLSYLSSAVYTYSVFRNNDLVDSGKWVK